MKLRLIFLLLGLSRCVEEAEHDRCLDAGGRWHESDKSCEGAADHYSGKGLESRGLFTAPMRSSAAGEPKDDDKTTEYGESDTDEEK